MYNVHTFGGTFENEGDFATASVSSMTVALVEAACLVEDGYRRVRVSNEAGDCEYWVVHPREVAR